MPDAADPFDLTAMEARVLGALIEKELTTPDAYPLTLNSLTTACNQTSNRDPIVRYEPHQVETTVLVLKTKGLARVVYPGSGERATKFRQVLDEALALGRGEQALLCVLLLRGPQTLNELRTRTERLHPYASTGEVEEALAALARRDPPVVAPVDRLPGQKEGRWIQLLEMGAEERAAASGQSRVTPAGRGGERIDELEARVAALQARVDALVDALDGVIDLPSTARS